ncbi:uncharacterized protein Z518_03902 [Rhinocladiella mackenziei CBS 650.93]|uniref:Methyltransferase type 11 domain-containing protein n=1 Tax=Rhinocladiella mackenziei CBS 650.93 TaxID=1442369 RepID=A0A0D2H6B2_9EURO|nr:uncharacterized protein Z518_03902 [Rhinocladiella mackenziei CBS 650.93]KIX05928.1 hypothetical protein Z518_03902 [Rhinocladiella mackenziei CBS 650.93]
MASTLASKPYKEEQIFRHYNSSSAVAYAQNRLSYPDKLIDLVISQHVASGGDTNLLLDIGCGPGTATRSLAPHFQRVFGVDPGKSMIETARMFPSSTKSGMPVEYVVCSAEEISTIPALEEFSSGQGRLECVDLITAATAAHWFDLPRFYGEAAKILKPGGSIIFWASGRFYANPNTTPNAEKVLDLLDKFELEVIGDYEVKGNQLCRELYASMDLPWVCSGELDPGLKALLGVFDKDQFVRLEFNKDGHVEPGETFYRGGRIDFERMRRLLGTGSPITRWREVNKEKLESGEIEDCVDVLIKQLKEAMEEVPEGKGRDYIDSGSSLVVMVMKKRK